MKKKFFACLWLTMLVLLCFFPFTGFSYEFTDLQGYMYGQTTKRISMDFRSAPLNDVLKIFSQQSGMNFIASADVRDIEINLYLDNVPIEKALKQILTANNLTYEMEQGSNIFVVKELTKPPVELITKVYTLQHATVPSSKIFTTLSAFEEQASR